MNKIWKQQGQVEETELLKIIEVENKDVFLAFFTDQFLSGYCTGKELEEIPTDKLLELRIFNEEREFLARRTMIGTKHKFQWRIASESEIKENREIQFLVQYQTIDMDAKKTREGKDDKLELVSTGGGHYNLPIKKEEDTIKVITYISYDEDGMAYIIDNRIAGFVNSEEMNYA